jgi:hypothetical protein
MRNAAGNARLLRICSGFMLQIRCIFAAREMQKPRVSATRSRISLQIFLQMQRKPGGGRGFPRVPVAPFRRYQRYSTGSDHPAMTKDRARFDSGEDCSRLRRARSSRRVADG